jgi:hypothetical protein
MQRSNNKCPRRQFMLQQWVVLWAILGADYRAVAFDDRCKLTNAIRSLADLLQHLSAA